MTEDLTPRELVLTKLQADPELLARFTANPKQVMKDELGIVLDDDVTVNVIEEGPKDLTFVLPAAGDDLDFEELDEVVGFSHHNANFGVNARVMGGPILKQHHNGDFSQNVSAVPPKTGYTEVEWG